jgi:hypothetical protein
VVSGLIARLVGPDAPAHAARTAARAEDVGFQDVTTTYRPQSGAYEVRGELPDETAQRTVDRILGR